MLQLLLLLPLTKIRFNSAATNYANTQYNGLHAFITHEQYRHPASVLFTSGVSIVCECAYSRIVLTPSVSTVRKYTHCVSAHKHFCHLGCTYFFYTFPIISVPLMLAFIQAFFCWGARRLLYTAENAARHLYEVQEMCALPPATSTAIFEFKPRACRLQIRCLYTLIAKLAKFSYSA